MGFNEQYFKIYKLVESDISKVSDKVFKEINVKEPLNTALKNFLTSPSKHIRTLTAFLYLKANNKEINEKQIILQTAIELIHNASLIHDDIIDESFERRGQKSLNNQFNNKLAVISGDYLLSRALKQISELKSSEILYLFSEIFKQMCEGEITQYFSKYKKIKLDEYITKTRQKTATLFNAAIEGAAIVSATLDIIKAKDFSTNFGIAFQIRDDLINAKTTQTDIKDGIYTAPIILSESENDLTDGIEKTYRLLNNYIDKTKETLNSLEENQYKLALIELLELLKNE